MEREGWACLECGACGEGVTLNVHHLYYEAGKAPWEYPGDALVTLCDSCHDKTHKLQAELHAAIVDAGMYQDGGLSRLIVELIEHCREYKRQGE
jgi:hypothetical protein